MSLVGMVIWNWYALKSEHIKTITKWMFAKLLVAVVQKGNFKQMHPIFIFRYRLEVWHGYTMESSHIQDETTCF